MTLSGTFVYLILIVKSKEHKNVQDPLLPFQHWQKWKPFLGWFPRTKDKDKIK